MTTDWRNPELVYEFSHTPPDAETVVDHDDWFIASWPDGTWCDWDERETYLTFMSDDYEKHRVLTYDGNGYFPLKTVTAF